MRTIYDCTDCQFCASFHSGDRLICTNPNLNPNKVCWYSPLSENNSADECDYFNQVSWNNEIKFSAKDWDAAEAFSQMKFDGEVTYEGLLAWVMENKK